MLVEEVLAPGEERELVAEGWRFILVTEGRVYWLGRPRAREVGERELLVIAPGSAGSVQASQINGARVRRFSANLGALLGVFSLAEREALRRLETSAAFGVEVLSRDHPATQLLAQVRLAETPGQRALGRGELLHVALLALANDLQNADASRPGISTAERRLRELMLNAPDADLLARSPEDIAVMCGCSVRHLRRLLRTAFQFNLRVAREEVRLHKARELVEQTGIRIADVARSVGYRHVGQFNASFKRLFGHTPSECRLRRAAALTAARVQ